MARILLFLFALLFHHFALADWEVKERVDAMTDEIKKMAYVKNAEGHSFYVYRISNGGAIWGNFALSDDKFDQVDWSKPPIYRVNKNEPFDLMKLKRVHDPSIGINVYEWEPKWVNFLLWHGNGEPGKALMQLMTGGKIVFRYHLSTGGYKDTVFTLKGADAAISKATGITTP